MSGNPPRNRRRRAALLIVILALCAAGAALWYSANTPVHLPPPTRVAVLPFADASIDDSAGGLADGFTAELISRLSILRGLQVIARSSAFRFRGADSATAEIARRLDAGSIVRGSVRMEGDTLEIHARLSLMAADPSRVLWSRDYRRPAAEFFGVQAEIANEVAGVLDVAVTALEKERLRRGGTRDPVALRSYLRGRDARNRGTAASALTGAEHFTAAIALDPSFAAAYAGLAECHAFAGTQARSPEARDTASSLAKRAALDALKLVWSTAEAHATLAAARFRFGWNFRDAEAGFRLAIGLKPSLASAREEYGRMLAILGRRDEALAELTTAAGLDPLATDVMNAIAEVRYDQRDYEASIEAYRRAIAADPSDAAAHLGMAMSCVAAVHYREAVEAVNEALRFTGETDETLAALGYVYAKRGDRAQAIEILDRFRHPAEGVDTSNFCAALILRGLDREDDAMAFLERAYLRRDPRLLELGVDPAWDGSRADPRFSALLKKIGLTD